MSRYEDQQSLADLCRFMVQVMKRGGNLDWPLYQGKLGSDSAGGTNLEAYIKLNESGILTLDSQDGYCGADTPNPEFIAHLRSKNVLNDNDDVLEVEEKQISYVQCIVPTDMFHRMKSLLAFYSSSLTTHINYHPDLGDAISHAIKLNGDLKQESSLTSTISSLRLRSGNVIQYPSSLGTPGDNRKLPKDIKQLVDRMPKYAAYRDIIGVFFFSPHKTHPSLMQQLVYGDYVICTFYLTQECTYPKTAADLLFSILKRYIIK